MAIEDLMETEVAAAAAVTAAAFSPRVRGFLRRGLVYGVAGAMEVGQAVKAGADGVAGAVQDRRPGDTREDGEATPAAASSTSASSGTSGRRPSRSATTSKESSS